MENTNGKKELEKFHKHRINVTWSGRYPHLCSGKWEIIVDNEIIDIPENKVKEPMGTYKKYVHIHFDSPKTWNEVHDEYFDGMKFEEWIKKNMWLPRNIRDALHIKNTEELGVIVSDVFDAITHNDWRHFSCGGCL